MFNYLRGLTWTTSRGLTYQGLADLYAADAVLMRDALRGAIVRDFGTPTRVGGEIPAEGVRRAAA